GSARGPPLTARVPPERRPRPTCRGVPPRSTLPAQSSPVPLFFALIHVDVRRHRDNGVHRRTSTWISPGNVPGRNVEVGRRPEGDPSSSLRLRVFLRRLLRPGLLTLGVGALLVRPSRPVGAAEDQERPHLVVELLRHQVPAAPEFHRTHLRQTALDPARLA